jgi:DeoR/GlpR family transcriptional regulator of sugar metabolism
MFAHARHHQILDLLRARRQMDVEGLRGVLGVSPATIRRDLEQLARTGQVLRVHGGVILRDAVRDEPSLQQKSVVATSAKKHIAAKAAGLVTPGATVFIDGGTTCLEAGLILRKRPDLTIITNSLPLLAAHQGFEARLIVPGGERRKVSGALVGALAVESIQHLRADIALIGASGLHPADGAGTTELLETEIKHEWVRRGNMACLLADSTKWDAGAMIRFAGWNEFHALVTDQTPPRTLKSKSLRIILS